MENLLFDNNELLEKNFDKWFARLKEESPVNYGNVLAKIWNQYAEDRMMDNSQLYDLNNKEDFLDFFINTGLYEKLGKTKPEFLTTAKWGIYDPNIDEKKDSQHFFYTDDGLADIIRCHIVEIAECMIAWPSLYPRDFYETIMWDIIRKSKLILSFEL